MHVEQRLNELGLELPPPLEPFASYVRFVQVGDLLIISGTTPPPGSTLPFGKVDAEVSVSEAVLVARYLGLCLLATAKEALGDLDRITRVLKMLGMVNSSPDFTRQADVINGCSDLLVSVLGEVGRHTRSAVGMAQLPRGVAVEIECMMAVE